MKFSRVTIPSSRKAACHQRTSQHSHAPPRSNQNKKTNPYIFDTDYTDFTDWPDSREGIHIGIKGGIKVLRKMSAEDIVNRKHWELHPTKKNSSWLSGDEFCEIIERLPVQAVLDEY